MRKLKPLVFGSLLALSLCASAQAAIEVVEKTFDPAHPRTQHGDDFAPGELALTFDDGPVPGNTPKLLQLLARYGVRANFFLVGKNAEHSPEIVRDMIAGRHAVGTHTYRHANLKSLREYQGMQAAADEVQHGVDVIQRITDGASLPFFRFPMIENDPETVTMVHEKGLIDFSFNVAGPGSLMRSSSAGLASGIMIFHDARPGTYAQLQFVLDLMERQGYRAVVFSLPRP